MNGRTDSQAGELTDKQARLTEASGLPVTEIDASTFTR